MPDVSDDLLQIAYSGSAIVDGRMPMKALATGLRGQALLIERVAQLALGDSYRIRVEVDENFKAESLVIPVHIITEGVRSARDFLAGPNVTAVANLMQLLGFFGLSGTSLYALYRKLNGRRVETPDDLPSPLRIDIPVELLIRILNDPEVKKELRKVLDPLREAGIDKFETRRAGQVIEVVTKRDVQIADEAEIADIINDEEVLLDIEKVAWRRDLAWHLNDGAISFDAKIKDDRFWRDVEGGAAFFDGDQMRVHLRTTARRTKQGTLKVERVIPEVIRVDHSRRLQRGLFDDKEQ